MVNMKKYNVDLKMLTLTEREQKMLKRLKDECVLHWVALGPEDVKVLNKLVKKGVAAISVGRAGRKAWAPIITDRDSTF